MVGDDERYPRAKLACIPAPQEIQEAVIVLRNEDRHSFRDVRVRDSPVHNCCRASGAKAATNLSRSSPKPSPSISSRIKKLPLPLMLSSLTYWSAERMLPSCIATNEEIAAIRPFLSGQETRSRML
jgi:hypothetical protein